MRGMIRVALIAGCAVLCAPIMAIAGVEEEVIAMTYKQWAADMEKDSAKALSILADDYTEFNFQAPTRIDGKKMAAKMAEATFRVNCRAARGESTSKDPVDYPNSGNKNLRASPATPHRCSFVSRCF